jgi:hypothetical protein
MLTAAKAAPHSSIDQAVTFSRAALPRAPITAPAPRADVSQP